VNVVSNHDIMEIVLCFFQGYNVNKELPKLLFSHNDASSFE